MSEQFDVVKHGHLVEWHTARFMKCSMTPNASNQQYEPNALLVILPETDEYLAHEFRINLFTYLTARRTGYEPGGTAYDDNFCDMVTEALDEFDTRMEQGLELNVARALPNEDDGWNDENKIIVGMDFDTGEACSVVMAKRETAFAGHNPTYIIFDELSPEGAEQFFKGATYADKPKLHEGVQVLDDDCWKVTGMDEFSNATIVSATFEPTPNLEPGDLVKINGYTMRIESVEVQNDVLTYRGADGRTYAHSTWHQSVIMKAKITHLDCPKKMFFPNRPVWPFAYQMGVKKFADAFAKKEDAASILCNAENRARWAALAAAPMLPKKEAEAALRSVGVLPPEEMPEELPVEKGHPINDPWAED